MGDCRNRNHIVYPEDNILAPCGGLLLDKETFEIIDVDGTLVLKANVDDLPPATYTELGAVIIGAGINVTPEGVISANIPRIVGTVTNGDAFPVLRPDGTPLIDGD